MPHRVQSEQTRQRRARLARERQGTDGRWESNRAKAAARAAKRGCHRLGALFTAAKARQANAQKEAFARARRFTTELDSTGSKAVFLGIISDLEKLPTTAKILWKTNLPKKLMAAGRKFPDVNSRVQRLIARWRTNFREEMAKRQARAATPSIAVCKAAAKERSSNLSSALLANSASVSGDKKRRRSASTCSSISSSSSSSSSSAAELLHSTPPPATAAKTGQQGEVGWQHIQTPLHGRRRPPKQQKLQLFFKTHKVA